MHPLIAKFLDLPTAIAALEKQSTDHTLSADEAALISAGIKEPALRAAVVKAKGQKHVSNDTQQKLIVLATRAAAARLLLDPALGPRVETAKAALIREGASAEEADALIAQAVLEEAFGYAENPDTFDDAFLAETLESLAYLAPVTQEVLDEWLETFATAGSKNDRALRLKVAETVLEGAWAEGPQPITPEHLDDALEHLADSVSQSELPKALEVVRAFLEALSTRQILGKERLRRLLALLDSASKGGIEPEPSEDEPDDDEA